ncbi:unnamed protein product [Psylliodes chrysocephalus]|uniref:Reverse transcriptase domain-containing protein n=1 Tax=Psylliodes chrysocephalus TaxID=3402493 RepID=A0A9P0GMY9_9CUCU|nr:unnamed protein product [Psylliodes chrysocephala]
MRSFILLITSRHILNIQFFFPSYISNKCKNIKTFVLTDGSGAGRPREGLASKKRGDHESTNRLRHDYGHDRRTEGMPKKSQGCKEQLTIDSMILKQAEKNQRNLYTCYIDYKKAFDSVPHK